jgi:hypothetical protein
MNPKILSIALLPLAVMGCSIQQTVSPIGRFEGRQVCIVENPAVSQDGFLKTYRRVLMEKGYEVKLLPPASTLTACPITSTYTANWRWDLALYMAYADIRVYKDGQSSGQAVYDSRSGGANMGKFIKGETKIEELVNQLFPGGAGT